MRKGVTGVTGCGCNRGPAVIARFWCVVECLLCARRGLQQNLLIETVFKSNLEVRRFINNNH